MTFSCTYSHLVKVLRSLKVQYFSQQIEIGGILKVSKKMWDRAIKTQKRNSLFITKLGQNCYGSKALMQRTVGQPKDSSKVMATPKKVDTFVGKWSQGF
jgi:hypothetical protein